jgi:hypothetical protein
MGIPEMEDIEEPRISQQAGVQDIPDTGLDVWSANQSEASPHLGVPEGSRVNSETTTSEADVPPEESVRSGSRVEANTSGLSPNEFEAAPTTGANPSVGPSSSSRISTGFEVLGRGLLDHPMEAKKNLIPEGFLGNGGVSSPEKIAKGILISHYQVSF